MNTVRGLLSLINLFPQMDIIISSEPNGGDNICMALLDTKYETLLAQIYFNVRDLEDPDSEEGIESLILDIATKLASSTDRKGFPPIKPNESLAERYLKGGRDG